MAGICHFMEPEKKYGIDTCSTDAAYIYNASS